MGRSLQSQLFGSISKNFEELDIQYSVIHLECPIWRWIWIESGYRMLLHNLPILVFHSRISYELACREIFAHFNYVRYSPTLTIDSFSDVLAVGV